MNYARSMRALLVLVVASSLLASAALAGPPAQPAGRKIRAQRADGATPPERVSVLVHLAPGAEHGRVRDFARSAGGRVAHEYALLPNVVSLRGIPRPALRELEQTEGVARVEVDGIVRVHLNDSTPLVRALRSDVEGANYTANGGGVRLCVVDTGIDSDSFLYADRIDTAAGRDFVNGDGDPEDDNGHGAHVAGIAVGGDEIIIDFGCVGFEPFQGVAWESTLIGVKVVDAAGLGLISDVIAGIDYCADQTAAGGRADVINVSLGGDSYPDACDGDTLAAAANAAVDQGVVVVASSGNAGAIESLPSPACGSKVMAVGATYDDDYPNCEFPEPSCYEWCIGSDAFCGCADSCSDCFPTAGQHACFSNSSRLLDVVAPGCITFSADAFASPNGATGFCGTSMAAPHVAGLAALLLSHDPALSPTAVRQAIRDGALDFGPTGFDSSYGYGMIDALNSLARVSCTTDAECGDADACTVDTCSSAGTCARAPASCGAADACCPAGCSAPTDADCPTCAPAGAICGGDSDCCSGRCRGKAGVKTCR